MYKNKNYLHWKVYLDEIIISFDIRRAERFFLEKSIYDTPGSKRIRRSENFSKATSDVRVSTNVDIFCWIV